MKSYYQEATMYDIIGKREDKLQRQQEHQQQGATPETADGPTSACLQNTEEDQTCGPAPVPATSPANKNEQEVKQEEAMKRQEKIRQAIIEGNPELRALQTKLAALKVAAMQKKQMQRSLKLATIQEATEIMNAHEEMTTMLEYARAAERAEEEGRRHQTAAQKRAWEESVKQRDATKKAQEEAVLQERMQIESELKREQEKRGRDREWRERQRQDLQAAQKTCMKVKEEMKEIERKLEI